MTLKATEFGFSWDQVEVQRTAEFSNEMKVITIKTGRREMDIYITPTGLLRVYTKPGDEWRPMGRKEPHGRRG